jgi:O-acetylserine/cysteine efflux transporter
VNMNAAVKPSLNLFAMLMALTVALAWGFNFAASKFSLLHFPPFFVIFIRYVIVAVVLLPFAKKIDLSIKQLIVLSLLMITLHFTLVFTAIWMGLDLGTTVIAIQLGAPFSCILGAIFLKDYLGPWRSFGMLVAFAGIVVIAGTPSVLQNELAFLLVVLGAAAWAASNVYMKVLKQTAIMPLLFWTALFSLPQTLAVSLLIESDHLALLQTAPWQAWAGIAYSGLVSTIVGYGLWYWLIRKYDVTQIVPFALAVPIGGFSSGILFFNEALTPTMMIGAALTIVGVAIITIRHPKLARPVRG